MQLDKIYKKTALPQHKKEAVCLAMKRVLSCLEEGIGLEYLSLYKLITWYEIIKRDF